MAQKISKNDESIKVFLESCKETSKLSVDVFWGRWDHIVAQKSEIKISLPRPLWTGPKNGCQTKKVDFFKVRDMLTII